jgi:hypothetical protein
MKNIKLHITGLLKKIFNIKNLNKVLILFIIGFSSRVIIGHIYDINVFSDYLNPISIIYYIFMSLLSVLVHEVVSFFNFSIIPSYVLEILFTKFNDNKLYLTDDSLKSVNNESKLNSRVITKGRSDHTGERSHRSSSSRNVERDTNNGEERLHRRHHHHHHHHHRSSNRSSNIQETQNTSTMVNAQTLPHSQMPGDMYFVIDSNLSLPGSTTNYQVPSAPRPSNLSTPSNLSANSGMFPPISSEYLPDNNVPSAPKPSNLSTPSNLSVNSGMFPPLNPSFQTDRVFSGESLGSSLHINPRYHTRDLNRFSKDTPSTTYTSVQSLGVTYENQTFNNGYESQTSNNGYENQTTNRYAYPSNNSYENTRTNSYENSTTNTYTNNAPVTSYNNNENTTNNTTENHYPTYYTKDIDSRYHTRDLNRSSRATPSTTYTSVRSLGVTYENQTSNSGYGNQTTNTYDNVTNNITENYDPRYYTRDLHRFSSATPNTTYSSNHGFGENNYNQNEQTTPQYVNYTDNSNKNNPQREDLVQSTSTNVD